jgi:short-subunit dehydrogenase/ubiquinone/menaquinone biosynthesis C-methylase UbiE
MKTRHVLLGLGLGVTAIGLGLIERQRSVRAKRWKQWVMTSAKRTALVTGASSGIGEAYARRLAAQGYDLVLVARREERLQKLAAELERQHTIQAEVLAADLSTEEGIARVEQRIIQGGDIDFLVNNAGYDVFGLFADTPIEKTLGLITCHVLASVRFCRAALPGMLDRRRGAIINLSSIGAFTPKSHDSTYVATKAYLKMFSETLAVELAGTGIHVQALCPGFTLSEFHDDPQYAQYRLKERIPHWLWMTSEQVVDESLRALGEGQTVCIPGWQNQLIVAAARSGASVFLLNLLRSFFPRSTSDTAGNPKSLQEAMRLSPIEFEAMNNAFRRWLQRTVEFPLFRSMGLAHQGQDILEVGCGSGYGAVLLSSLQPQSYIGVDLMPEQIALAQARQLPNATFMVQDASDLACCPDESKDVVVIFGVLHHIVPWREVVREAYRVLRRGGMLFVEEPDGRIVDLFDRLFHWGHAKAALFRLDDFECHLAQNGFALLQKKYLFGFGFYAAKK